MRLSAPGVRIADVETCDFALMPCLDTADLLRAALPGRWERYLASAVSRRLIAALGVERRYLTQLPGRTPDPARLNAMDLARSAVARLQARRLAGLTDLDALIFVSSSNPRPVNSQAALLADALGISASCMDLKAGCSGGVLGVMQAALLIQAGCERVLVVMAENLSQLTSPHDLRMLLTVGDGAACVLVEKAQGPGFLSMLHGTEPAWAGAMAVGAPFPPTGPSARYVYEVADATAAREFLGAKWRELYRESLVASGTAGKDLAQCAFHQTHLAQVDGLVKDLGLDPARVARVVQDHGNMGSPTFAVALARCFAGIAPGQRYLLQAVGGGISWCAIVAEHC